MFAGMPSPRVNQQFILTQSLGHPSKPRDPEELLNTQMMENLKSSLPEKD